MLKKKLTEQELLKYVDDNDIFRRYFGNYDFNTCYSSIFRKDEKPSTGFFVNKEGRIVYNDFAKGDKYSAVNFVAKLFGITYYEAIDKIAADFNLIADSGKINLQPKYIPYKVQPKRDKEIQITACRWKPELLDYWKQFSITRQELDNNHVYPISKLFINGILIPNAENQLRFAYHLKDEKDYLKIYSPYDPDYKWVSNIPLDKPFGLNELPFASDTLFITKGQKDRIIWKKYFSDVIATQNESKSCLTQEQIDFLNSKYKKIYVNYDCDKAGKEAAQHYLQFGWESIFVPDAYFEKLGIKDFADFVKDRGLSAFEKFLQWKHLI